MRQGALAGGLRTSVAKTYDVMSQAAASIICNELKKRPDLLLCVSAGGTPTRTYELLAARSRREPRLFARLRVIQIDEWGGLLPGDPATCEADLRTKLCEPLGVAHARFTALRTNATDPAAECSRIARWLAANGPIDICILGLGRNGHVAMNEPGAALTPHAHVAMLAPSSRQHAMLKTLAQKPRYGLTLGMGDILSSRQILLLVNGKRKRAALRRLMRPTVSTRFPASLLWLHPSAIVLCDREAAAGFPNRH
jgi:galactosamine-6-phosphate isomerase